MSAAKRRKPPHPNDRPYPVKLGDLKPTLQKEAYENEKSLHYWIKKILREYLAAKKAS